MIHRRLFDAKRPYGSEGGWELKPIKRVLKTRSDRRFGGVFGRPLLAIGITAAGYLRGYIARRLMATLEFSRAGSYLVFTHKSAVAINTSTLPRE